MKKLFKFIGILLVLLIVGLGLYYFANNEALPEGKKGKEADALAIKMFNAINNDAFENTTPLTRFLRVKTCFEKGTLSANIIVGNGSGDLTSLAKSDGFIRLKPNTNYKKRG